MMDDPRVLYQRLENRFYTSPENSHYLKFSKDGQYNVRGGYKIAGKTERIKGACGMTRNDEQLKDVTITLTWKDKQPQGQTAVNQL